MDFKGDQMKISKFFAVIFGLLGAAIAAGTVFLCLQSLNQEPVLLKTPIAATTQVESLMRAICKDDYAAASELIYGNPDLGANLESEDAITSTIWDAFISSIEYEMVGDCYATNSGVAQNVHLKYLDIVAATEALQIRARNLLEQRINEADDMEDIYDENNEFRQDFLDAIVVDAVRETVAQDAQYLEADLTVNLAFTDGKWWIVADDALVNFISGGMEQ